MSDSLNGNEWNQGNGHSENGEVNGNNHDEQSEEENASSDVDETTEITEEEALEDAPSLNGNGSLFTSSTSSVSSVLQSSSGDEKVNWVRKRIRLPGLRSDMWKEENEKIVADFVNQESIFEKFFSVLYFMLVLIVGYHLFVLYLLIIILCCVLIPCTLLLLLLFALYSMSLWTMCWLGSFLFSFALLIFVFILQCTVNLGCFFV
jgi:hypothetical protein